MRLDDYLKARPKKLTATVIAQRCGVAPSTISRIAAGTIEPSLKRIRQIAAATDGEVSATDWIGDDRAATRTSRRRAA